MKEKQIESRLVKEVKRLGGLAVKMNSFSMTGLPDRMVLMPEGKVFFCETKTTGKKPRPRQLSCISMLNKLGFSVSVVDDEETFEDFITMIEQ